MAAGTVQKGQLLWLGLAALVALFGLCTIFAAVVTAQQAWQEHAEGQWPEVTAHVDRCWLQQSSSGRRNRYYIDCRLNYAVDGEQNEASVYSRRVPAANVPQRPANRIGLFEKWIERHPAGTPIEVRYDPADHTKIVLAATDMPYPGPRTAGPKTSVNLKLLAFFAVGFLLLLVIAWITRPARVPERGGMMSEFQ